jgi:microsomal dipeptidase-like Zn-dependent dipeptidase
VRFFAALRLSLRSNLCIVLHFSTPLGLEDVSRYPALFAELIRTGQWSADELKQLAGLNFLRVIESVENVSARKK